MPYFLMPLNPFVLSQTYIWCYRHEQLYACNLFSHQIINMCYDFVNFKIKVNLHEYQYVWIIIIIIIISMDSAAAVEVLSFTLRKKRESQQLAYEIVFCIAILQLIFSIINLNACLKKKLLIIKPTPIILLQVSFTDFNLKSK